jgi:hypothetical protein
MTVWYWKLIEPAGWPLSASGVMMNCPSFGVQFATPLSNVPFVSGSAAFASCAALIITRAAMSATAATDIAPNCMRLVITTSTYSARDRRRASTGIPGRAL